MTAIQPVPKTTPARLEIIYKLKETLETGSPEVAISVMIGGLHIVRLLVRTSCGGGRGGLTHIMTFLGDIAHCALHDKEPGIPKEMVFVTSNLHMTKSALHRALKFVPTAEFMDSFGMAKVVERQARE